MTPKFYAYRLVPLLTISMLLLNLLAPVGIVFAQDGSPPPDPPPSEEMVVEEQQPEEQEGEPQEANEPEGEGQEEPGEPIEPETETGEEPTNEAAGEGELEESDEPKTGEAEEAEDEEPTEAGEEPATEGLMEMEEPTSEEEQAEGEEGNPVAEAVEKLDEADAVLLDENGEPLNMASQEAEEVLTAPDPMFCPAGVAYGGTGCYPSQTSIADALNDWATAGYVSGTIYIEGGNFAGVTISESQPAADLVFQGGVGGGVTTITSQFTVNNSTFSSFTFNDISFDAGFSADTNTGNLNFNDVNATNPTGDGLDIDGQDGSIQLHNVTANNSSRGIDINNVSGNLSLNQVTTNNNGSRGIEIDNVSGNLSLNQVTASNNGNDGLNIEADGNITVSNLTASNNSGDGLEIDGAAAVTLNNVTANGSIDADGVEIDDVTGNVTLNQVVANGNGDHGIEIDNISGNLTITNTTANNNNDGMWIDDISGSVSLRHVTANNNTDGGIDFQDIGGTITVFDVTASGNGGNGIEISGLASDSDVFITCSALPNNGNFGFSINGNSGDLYLSSVTTGGNANGNNTTNVSNIFINQVDCDPHEGYPRDGEKVELHPDEPTTIELDLYPHSITFPPMNLAECTGFARSLFFPGELPDDLPAENGFLRALSLQLEGCPIPAGAEFSIGFAVPAAEQGNDFAILYWNGAEWVEVPGALNGEGRYEVNWPQTGVFVLVTK